MSLGMLKLSSQVRRKCQCMVMYLPPNKWVMHLARSPLVCDPSSKLRLQFSVGGSQQEDHFDGPFLHSTHHVLMSLCWKVVRSCMPHHRGPGGLSKMMIRLRTHRTESDLLLTVDWLLAWTRINFMISDHIHTIDLGHSPALK